MTVAAAASARVAAGCESGLYPVGSKLRLGIDFKSAAGSGLVGLVPDALEGEGLEENFASYSGTGYLWDSVVASQTVAQSAHFRDVKLELRAFSGDEMEIKGATLRAGRSFIKGFGSPIETHVSVSGEVPCESGDLKAKSNTPEVCTHDGDATTWRFAGDLTTVTPLKSGICMLALAPDMTDNWKEFNLSVELD